MTSVASFIIARNEEENIGKTIDSLKKQTYDIHPIVVVDDGSIDNTLAIAIEKECQIVRLPYHEESYVGRWELGRSINHGLREILKSGVPDFILQLGGDHGLPDNYVSELVDRMTDTIRISSGTYEGAQLNIDTPIGSGKIIDAKLWDKFSGMTYPEKYGYESWIDYRFRKEGYEVSRHDDLVTDCRPVRMGKKKAYYWGKCTYALGGILPFAVLKAFSIRGYGPSFLKGYCSRGDVEKHKDICDYVGDMQWEKARKQGLSILNKWRHVKV